MSSTEPSPTPRPKKRRKKAFWTKQFYLWHWVSSAICLFAMLLFAFTGITLNHAADIPAEPEVTEKSGEVPESISSGIAYQEEAVDEKKPLPSDVATHLGKQIGASLKGRDAEWSEYEIYLSMPRPGGDAWLMIDRETREFTYEHTDRGVISYLNDLHKGRHTGKAWSWFLDIFSGACVVFCLTGLVLLWVHAKRRPSTWPIVAAGILVPILLVIFFVH
ncbi:PepSY-associated TM helix domain-containing protein [Verrucomicrobiaceae bacterium R5-34]|nr:PepSY-associated TM helix domain-containing protein [Verrucomicrobiaceae bacterium R5-34]